MLFSGLKKFFLVDPRAIDNPIKNDSSNLSDLYNITISGLWDFFRFFYFYFIILHLRDCQIEFSTECVGSIVRCRAAATAAAIQSILFSDIAVHSFAAVAPGERETLLIYRAYDL